MLHDPELHYLDNAATTIVAPEVADVIDKAMREHWANPSSLYAPGARSEEVLNAARAAVARTLGCKSKELYFTSCGSEGNNLALLGAAQTRTFGKGIVVSGFEHPSVQRPLERLAAQGYNVTVVKPQADGTLDINKMLDAVDKNTILVACMMVNNEIGTRSDVERLAAEVKRRNSRTIVHVDAVQAWMRVPIKLDNIDTMTVSGHKIHGPKGVGFLYIDEKVKIKPLLYGGGQQRDLRSGTENVPGIAGLGLAAQEMYRDHEAKIGKITGLKDYFIDRALELEDVTVNSQKGGLSAPQIVSLSFKGVRSEVLLHALEDKEIYVSSGSACSSNHPAISGTLKAVGVKKELLDSTLRFSFGLFNTKEEIDYCMDVLKELLPVLRRYYRA